ncbi:helix-turn-helix transcriptional regulator [Mediterraneibacter sp. NSJ-55]|uniref:Helix-turn-helix transcriptional regulator n=1 Tax=Mediterraneibacter hominis TaxID=2763054 RepID=A0A923RP97_9FIRM|nr:helix-turn-helix transcriptional regulator [Mediterraneibacter hominis]MBC5688186.1 helix-turn-helix transcriptional regulator [Mediterraneibacter hominis]
MLEYKSTEQFLHDYRKYLNEKGITNAHVARKMNISPQQLQNIFKKKQLNIIDLKKLCNAIDLEFIIDIKARE